MCLLKSYHRKFDTKAIYVSAWVSQQKNANIFLDQVTFDLLRKKNIFNFHGLSIIYVKINKLNGEFFTFLVNEKIAS